MRPNKDAYGQEIWSFYNGEKVIEVSERDDGFINPGGNLPASYFLEFKSWQEYERTAIKFAKGNVLDVGAGAGRVSLYLQKRGLDVTAMDSSPLAVKVCKKRGVKKARILAIEEIGKLKLNAYDTIIMYGNNFGLFGSFKKAGNLLKKLYRITTPDALIIAETHNPYVKIAAGRPLRPEHRRYHRRNRERGRMGGQLKLRIRHKSYIGKWFYYLLVSKKEMKEILKNTGWRVKKFINSNGAAYIAVIEKI
jgi:SAM-dependent methyltransferase